jgi:hypothetical protein
MVKDLNKNLETNFLRELKSKDSLLTVLFKLTTILTIVWLFYVYFYLS